MPVDAVLHTDPACPWAYSASPALAVLRRRFGEHLRWRIVVIGLSEDPGRYARMGRSPAARSVGQLDFRRRFGMPFGAPPRARHIASGRACRAIVAVRARQPELEWAALRALQFAWFCSDALLDEDDAIEAALATVPGLDAAGAVAALADPAIEEAYQADRAEARTAAGTPTEAQGKASAGDGPVRYTAPSVVFTAPDGRTLEAGGFQSLDAYDVCLANLDPALPRVPGPADAAEALNTSPHGLTTQEVAALLTPPLGETDRRGAEGALLELVGSGQVRRRQLGDDALWTLG